MLYALKKFNQKLNKLNIQHIKVNEILNSGNTGNPKQILVDGAYRIIELESGKIVIQNDVVRVFQSNKNHLYPLAPLFEYSECQEIFIRVDKISTTINGRRYVVEVKDYDVQEFIENLAIFQGVNLNLTVPYAETFLKRKNYIWRIYLKLREKEIIATRITRIPLLTDYDPLLAARLILTVLKPNVLCICGPTGSGKTTLLNSIILGIHYLYPYLRICVIEQVRELILPPSALVSRAVAYGDYDVTFLLRQAFRYERPSIIVLGELRSENIETWFEVSKGLASITTMHAKDLDDALSFMLFYLRAYYPRATLEDLYSIVNAFVFMRKIETASSIMRKISSFYIVNNNKVVKVYDGKNHISDEDFIKLIGDETMVGDARIQYTYIKDVLFKGKLQFPDLF